MAIFERKIIGQIRIRREELQYTQLYMATRLNISQNCYSKLELGQNKLTLDRLFAICELLSISAEELIVIATT